MPTEDAAKVVNTLNKLARRVIREHAAAPLTVERAKVFFLGREEHALFWQSGAYDRMSDCTGRLAYRGVPIFEVTAPSYIAAAYDIYEEVPLDEPKTCPIAENHATLERFLAQSQQASENVYELFRQVRQAISEGHTVAAHDELVSPGVASRTPGLCAELGAPFNGGLVRNTDDLEHVTPDIFAITMQAVAEQYAGDPEAFGSYVPRARPAGVRGRR